MLVKIHFISGKEIKTDISKETYEFIIKKIGHEGVIVGDDCLISAKYIEYIQVLEND